MWIVEKYIKGRLAYYCPGARGRSSQDDWSESFDFAIKFHNEESADMALIHLCRGEGRSVRHAYIGAPETANT